MKILLSIIAFLCINTFQVYAQDSEQLKQEAQGLLDDGKLGEAINILNKYISAEPGKADGFNLRGLAYEKRGEYENAVYDFTSAIKLAPDNKEIRRNLDRSNDLLTKVLLNRIEGYKREIAKNPEKAVNYLEIAKAYKSLKDPVSAEYWYDEYLKKEVPSADEVLRYTEVLALNKKFQKGLVILKRFTESHPDDHRLWSRYGYFNLWSGNNKTAILAFENALKIRPYFREAMDGLDQAKGKGYNYTYYTGRKSGTEYPIDKYFRQLKKDPENINLRLLLIKELMDKKRLEEAYEQLQILSKDSSQVPEFNNLWTRVMDFRNKQQTQKINDMLKSYRETGSKKLLLQLAQAYRNKEVYDSAAVYYTEHLKTNPGDINARFEYAEVLAWDLDYTGSKQQLNLLLALDPENEKYKLLYALISVWMVEDLEKAKQFLEEILEKDPYNLEALIALSSLSMQNKEFADAEGYIARAKNVAPENERVIKLESDLDFNKMRAEEEKNFQVLEQGRVLALENKCKEALLLYDEYLSKTEPGRLILREYADVNACAGNFKKAIQIYDELLAAEYDFETDLERAKVYYWSGDSLNALKEFERLYASHPENFQVRLHLGDTYTKMKRYVDARRIYDNLLGTDLDSVQTELVTLRLGWLPVPGTEPTFGAFPSYLMASPSFLYYADNLKFTYSQQALRVDIGLTSFLTLAPEASLGYISSETIRKNFNSLKGNLLFRFTPEFTAGAGAGISVFSDYRERTIADAFIRYEKPERFSTSLIFSRQDAVQVLYSPNLVDLRLDVNLFRFTGFYRFGSGIKLAANLTHTAVSDGNRGSFGELEAGKYFGEKLFIGYEYYRTTFERVEPEYFSPVNYNSHSLFGEYDFIREAVNRLSAGAKIGIIANSDYILREVYTGGIYSLFRNFALQGRLGYGTSIQNQQGYSSFSIQLAAYWLF